MNEYTADAVRKYARVGCCICALIAVIAAIIAWRGSASNTLSGALTMYRAYTAARISSIVLFGVSAVILVIDLVSKSFSLKFAAIGLAIAVVGFIGSFLIAPGCSAQELYDFALKKATSTGALATGDISQIPTIQEAILGRLAAGRYMILGSGVVALGFNIRFIKSDG